ncbi:MAG: winged helix-turn-helix transcriptional regulator [Solirubrobacterales bacterium]|nr:winged helix-turn-helix transcriptional regulator [Solirubrobacterales bacterium]
MTDKTINAIETLDDPRVALLKELADPIRLRVVDRLGHAGPATVSRLAAELGASLPQLSNHLRRLRDAGLVEVRRSGRQAVYELADPGLQQLLPLLDSITGRVLEGTARDASTPQVPSRTCYDHLGGAIGVAIYRGLRDRDAVRPQADGTVELGPTAGETFGALGVDVESLTPGRQRLAFECLDSTERAPHLAGALGDALTEALLRRRWIKRRPGSRVIALTPGGAEKLQAALGIVDAAAG